MTDKQMTPTDFVRRCREYAEKASEGPWYLVEAPWRPNYYDKKRGEHVVLPTYVVAGNPDPHSGQGVLNSFDIDDGPDGTTHDEWVQQSDFDLEFAAKSRTDLPAALLLIEQLIRERDEARAEVERWQKEPCFDRDNCPCGVCIAWRKGNQ